MKLYGRYYQVELHVMVKYLCSIFAGDVELQHASDDDSQKDRAVHGRWMSYSPLVHGCS